VVARNTLIDLTWGEDEAAGVSEQAFDALVRRLRDRIAQIDPEHEYIVTIRGHGMRLDNPQKTSP
jgi:DNA-binding response OmpR family regulator